jgi:hypothetical protein
MWREGIASIEFDTRRAFGWPMDAAAVDVWVERHRPIPRHQMTDVVFTVKYLTLPGRSVLNLRIGGVMPSASGDLVALEVPLFCVNPDNWGSRRKGPRWGPCLIVVTNSKGGSEVQCPIIW